MSNLALDPGVRAPEGSIRVKHPGEPVVDEYPLTPMQEAMLLRSRRDPGAGYYLQQFVCTLREPLRLPELREAWQRLATRHPILRTSFHLDSRPEPVQRVHRVVRTPWSEHDWRGLARDAQAESLRAFLREDRSTPFRPEDAPLARLSLFRLADELYQLVWTTHHALFDGYARRILLEEVFADYEAGVEGLDFTAASRRPYGEFVRWLQREDPGDSRAFWEEELRGFEPAGELVAEAADHAPERKERYDLRLSGALTVELRELAAREAVTLNSVLQGAWALLLSRYTGSRDVVFGAPRACRRGGFPGAGEVVGQLGNTVPVRVRLDVERSAADCLADVRALWVRMRPHERTNLARIQEWSGIPGGTPLFQTIFGFETETTQDSLHRLGERWRRRTFELVSRTGYPLAVVAHGGERIAVAMNYETDRFGGEAIRRMGEHFTRILHAFAENPDQPLGRIEMLSPAERHHLVEALNPVAEPHAGSSSIPALFQAQAARAPDAVAAVFLDETLTYGELDRRSNRLAHALRRRGVGPETRVGVCMERSLELLIALVAISKAGGAYVPLDPESPRERLSFVVDDAGISQLLCQPHLAGRLPARGPVPLAADPLWEQAAGESAGPVPVRVEPHGLAYLMYTSGSTGSPKGVGVEHRGVVRLVRGASYVDLGPREVVLQAAPVSFDASTLELWGALLNGARLVLAPAGIPSLEELGRTLGRHGVTTLWLTTGLFQAMVDEQLEALGGVGQLLAGGDVVPVAPVEKVRKRFPALRLINGYGPTENTTFTCCYTVPPEWDGGPLPIGVPIAGTRVYVLDEALRLVPEGVPGELYAGGDGVARGYLGRPAATAERFLPDPFAGGAGARMYRTGDRARWRPDGALEFLGRLDGQVKIRGFRIHPGEVEETLRRCPGVRECAVAVREDVPGEKRLVAYVAGDAATDGLRAHLRDSLPEYMVPGSFVAIDRLPLTLNGKLDRRALPAPGPAAAGERDSAPRTPAEEVLAGIWMEVLRLETVGVEESFFELGGHSLLAMRVLSRVREVFGVELPVHALFKRGTVAAAAERVEQLRGAGRPVLAPVARVERTDAAPLSFAQERLWFVHQLEGVGALYNIPVARRLCGVLDVEALERALGEVVRRQDALRTRFREAEGALVQDVVPWESFVLPRVDLTALGDAERESEVARRAAEDAARPFDLAAGPLFRASLLRLRAEEHVLLLCVHHVVSDGWSMEVLFRELSALYGAHREGREPSLPEPPVRYADYAVWQRENHSGEALERQLAYWRERLAGAPELLELPTDHPRPAVQTHRGARERIELPGGLVERLRTLGRSEGATLYMVLLGAFQVLLSRYSGSEDVVVGTPVAGRMRRELEELVGCFANTLVLRTDLGGDPAFRDVLRRVREATLGAYEHQDVPFERLVAVLRPERSLSHSPLFQVTFTLQEAGAGDGSLAGLRVEEVETEARVAKFDLLLAMEAAPRGLRCGLTYATDLFERGTIVRMLGHLERVLEQAARDADVRLSGLRLMGDAERARLVEEWSRRGAEFPPDRCVHQRFEARALEQPDSPALTFGGATLTYRELNERANLLAHRLRARGVAPETRVGIALERSAELVAAILAVLKAGAAYVPLDPAYPQERIAFVLEDAGIGVLVTTSDLLPRLPACEGAALCIDSAEETIPPASGTNPDVQVGPDALAYVIYTSGSTGRPKGVQVTHANVVRLFDATDAWFGFGADDVWTLFHSCAFDFSVWEIWGALLYGGRLVVVPFLTSRSPEDFHRLLVEEGVTVLSQTPSAFRQQVQADLASGAEPSALRLRHVVFGGEALDPQSLLPWVERHGDEQPRLVNMYGITETTVHVTYRRITRPDLDRAGSPIGVPIPDLSLYVLDARLEPVPHGVPGEIFVGGAGVARGYLNRPELTAERFIRDPFSADPAARLYRSGDLARRRANGELEYLGRADQQVKVRGFRIETGEIEAALAAHPAVAASAVVAREDGAGERRLVAYVVARPGEAAPASMELRAHLAGSLPDYMVPAAFVLLDRLPLTENGKLDRRSLPAPEEARDPVSAESCTVPRTAAEAELAAVWREVLEVERVGMEDNYFALGGDSIRSVRLVAAARRRGLTLSIPQLYRHQTVRALAASAGLPDGAPSLPRPSEEPFALLDPGARAGLPEDLEDAYPASHVQLGMLYHTERDPESLVYHEVLNYRVQTRFDEAAMREALRRLTERHPLLRTSFDLGARPEPIQRVHRLAEVPLEVVDLRHLDRTGQDEWVDREKWRGFDWTRPPLLRFHVHLLAEDVFRLVLVEHHAALDGWSVASLTTELLRLHVALRDGTADPTGPAPAARFRDFVALERAAIASGESRAFWRRMVADAPAATLPAREGSDAVRPHDAPCLWIDLPACVSGGLRRAAEGAGVPLKTVLLAAYLRVLALVGGSGEAVAGYVTSGRPETEDGERVLGVFLNTVPLRVEMAGGTWLDLVRRTWAAEEALLPHRRFPLAEIVREAGGRVPFEAAFNFVHFHVYDSLAAAGVRLESDRSFQRTEVPLLASAMLDSATGELRLRLEYHPARLAEAQVRAIAGWYARSLAAVAGRPRDRWDADGLLSGEDEARLRLLGAGAVVTGEGRAVSRLFEAQVERTPEAVAVVSEEASLTYRELDEQANRLARRLARIGVGPEARVGVCLERSQDLVVSLLAVLKAGAAYVPLDPEHPAERLARVLADSGASVLLMQGSPGDGLGGWGGRVVALDQERGRIGAEPRDPVAVEPDPESLAYVIYTSGSTGAPKGVAVPHRALSSHMAWMQRAFPVGAGDRVLQKTPVGFDASVWEFWLPLLTGATLVVAPPGVHRDPSEMLRIVQRERITELQLVPAVLRGVLEHPALAECRTLRRLFCGGEALPTDLAARARAVTGAQVVNLYGPTEVCIQSVVHPFAGESAGTVPIGSPVDNVRAHVLDAAGTPVPPGVPGELYLGGAQLARGYLGRPGPTAETFVPDPFAAGPGARLYRTGDRVRWLSDGVLEFLGRMDQQVKIRGLRVEPGEVEILLAGLPQVREAVVAVREDAPGEKRLVAYVVPATGAEVSGAALRAQLSSRLPAQMVPGTFVMLERLPLNANGKVDRRALPVPEQEAGAEHVAPSTPVQEMLAGIWAEVLKADRIGVEENFFELGGHSLLAIQVISRVRQALGAEVPLKALFDAPTVAAFAGRVEALRATGASLAPPIPRLPRAEPLPLSFAQQRLWLVDRIEPASPAYNMPFALRLRGALDVAALRAALDALVRRHEALRTVFTEHGGQPMQVVRPHTPVPLPVVELGSLPPGARAPQAERLAGAEAVRPFDLVVGPLLRTMLLRLGPEDHVLCCSMHHIVCDGWSMQVLVREVSALYAAARAGEPSPLPELPVQYADYAVWQREWLSGEVLAEQVGYWKERLHGAPPLLELPTDRARAVGQSPRAASHAFALSAELSRRLRTLTRREGATLFMTLLGAWQALLARYAGQEDVVVGSPIAGRSWRETEDLIGFFVNMLCLRSELAGDLTWAELLGRVRVMALEAYAHQDLPFERLVEELAVERSTTHSPIFQVVFALSRSAGQDGLVLDEVGATRFRGGDRVIKFDLDLTFQDAGATLTGTLTYRAALFEAQTVTRMAAHLETLLEAMVADPARRLSDVSLLRAAERARLLEEWNPAPAEHPYAPVHELFAGQAARRPDAVAVVFGEESLAYAELDRRADLLAHHLASLGVRRNHRVGICVQRGLEMVVGILGVLKAGAAYVPLDPALPPERLAFMLADAAVPALLTQERLLDRLPEHAAAVVCLDRDWSVIEQRSPGAPRVEVGPEDLFCVIYTSGSTGEPKGTEVPHRAVPGFFRGADYARFDEEHTLLQYSSVSWDALTLELWPALLTGGRTVLYPGDGADLEGLEQEVEARGVTTLWMTAALFNLAVDTRPSLLRRLSQAIIGGEALSPAHVRRALEEAPALRLANGYGPSECTVFTACQVLTPEVAARPSIPIGRPVGDRRVYVLDRVLSPVPAGLPGELLVGGPAVPVGYLGRPEQTAEKLVPDPFGAPGARLYRTGDRVRWTASGELEFLGRMDRQVKVRGFRIEVEEIEAALTGHPRVREAAVSVWEHGEEKRLVGYVVPDDGGGAPAAELRGWLRERMPEYMVPSAFVMLERLPLTRNGKVDRRALPVPERSGSARNGAHLRPRDPLESTLAGIFEEVLDVTGVGLDDSFFDLGGHSLLAVRLMSRLQDAMGVRLPAAALFRAPTVERLAEEVRVGSGGETPLLVPIRTGGCRTPLFLVHPGGGGLLGYAALVGRLGDDQPVYGLRSRGVEPGEKPTLTIEEMARHYLAAVREVRPSGPYRLGGWSLGGVIAFEMARQLEASGEEVERLVLIDSQVPWLLQQRRAAPPEGSLLVQMFAQDAGLAAEPLPPPGPEARGAGEAAYLRCLLETARAGGQIPGDLDLVRMQHLYGVFRTNVQALYGYCPEVYTGPVTLLRASNGEPNERHPGKSNGWERVARGVEVRQVPGTHYTMLRKPEVEILARAVERALR